MSMVDLNNKTILVTGAAGFIGSNLVKRIYQETTSATVIGIDNMNDYYDVALKEFRLNELAKYPTLICYFTFYRKKKITIKTLLLFVPLVVTLAWNQIYYYFFSSIQGDSARYQLLINSFKVIKDHFPIGSGFGTYASYYSGKYYSPIYSSYGLTGIYGLTRDNTSFISDSFWPMVFAQTGLIGTIAFGCALLRLFKQIQKIRITSMAFYASAISVLSYLLIASTAESAFVHGE